MVNNVVKTIINNHPVITILAGGIYIYTLPKWVVYDIVLTTLLNINLLKSVVLWNLVL